uniref:Uncharacterized protein n=1 Tax=Arundo donax TaxID=35708 RepID=A0A0A9D0T2_ARUDO
MDSVMLTPKSLTSSAQNYNMHNL